MKTIFIHCLAAVLFAAAVHAQEVPQMPEPSKEHEFLQRFAGEWDYEVEIFFEAGQPPMKGQGKEVARMIGGFWVVGEGSGKMGDMVFSNITTFGYDPDKKKYIGTGIDSASSTLWDYVGTVDEGGNVLTFETEGPCPMRGGAITQFRGVIEFKSDDHRIFTSYVRDDDGKWTPNVIVHSRRSK